MDIKQKFNRSFLFNLAVILAIIALLYVLFFAGLGVITRHGKEINMPNVIGRDLKIAEKELEHLSFEVDVDSAYDPKQKPFVVLSQMPDVNAIVKRGRTVFLTVNKAEAPLTPMPNLLNLSFRSAEMILKSNKLSLGDTSYRPDIAKGAILEQLYKGKAIRAGEPVPQGSKIDLVIGDGLGDTEFDVPDVIGMAYNEGIAVINANGLNFTAIWEGDITDSATAVIYMQYPPSRNELTEQNRIKEGDIIDIRIKQNPTPEDYGTEAAGNETE